MKTTHKTAFALYALRKGKGFPSLQEAPTRLEPLLDEIASWENKGIKILLNDDKAFPPLLSSVQKSPPLIFYKGEIPTSPMLGVVGTRKAEKQALVWTENFAKEIADHGNCIVSGLAYGIDAASHKGALNSGKTGATIAVLAGGLSNVYPRAHEKLAEKIIDQGGALISIHEPNEPPLPRYFLERNQIIAGLSLGVVVVQAAERSGSIATANAALDQGRELLAVPGSIFNHLSVGTNRLIKAGAHMVLSVDDVFDSVSGLLKVQKCKTPLTETFSYDQINLIKALSEHDKIHIDDLVEILNIPISSVASLVSDLELQRVLVTDSQDFVYLTRVNSRD